jgi:hypothetical protein
MATPSEEMLSLNFQAQFRTICHTLKKKFNFFISVSFRSYNFKVRQSSIIAFVFFITLDRSLIIDVSCTNSLLIYMFSNSAIVCAPLFLSFYQTYFFGFP